MGPAAGHHGVDQGCRLNVAGGLGQHAGEPGVDDAIGAYLTNAAATIDDLARLYPPPCLLPEPRNTPRGYAVGEGMPGYSLSKEELLKRLRRIEGQTRGVAQMVEDDRYCIDVLTQISAIRSALESVAVGLVDDHIRHCVADAMVEGGPKADERLTEATAAIARLLKS